MNQEKPGTRPPSCTTPQQATINVGLRSTEVIENDLLGQKQIIFSFSVIWRFDWAAVQSITKRIAKRL